MWCQWLCRALVVVRPIRAWVPSDDARVHADLFGEDNEQYLRTSATPRSPPRRPEMSGPLPRHRDTGPPRKWEAPQREPDLSVGFGMDTPDPPRVEPQAEPGGGIGWRLMQKAGYKGGQDSLTGLGASEQGRTGIVEVEEKHDQAGIGFTSKGSKPESRAGPSAPRCRTDSDPLTAADHVRPGR